MKLFLLLNTILTLSVFTHAQVIHAKEDTGGSLVIKIIGLESNSGKVLIALSDSRNNYYNYENPYLGVSAAIRNQEAVYVFNGLPSGEYAIKVFHDENNDNNLDTNFLGIPVEDYGFSNNARGLFGVPDYDDAKFFLTSGQKIVEINIK
jgi:uncharacterized protein (DUF2141 family)